MRRIGNSRPLAGCGMALGLAVLVLPGAGWAQDASGPSLDEVQAEFAEAFEAIGAYGAQERDAALEALGATLGRLDAEIDALERRTREDWSEMSRQARERTTAALRDLRAQRNRLSEVRGAMTEGVDTAWDDLVEGVDAAWTDLEHAWDDAAAALGPENGTGE